MKTIKKIDCLSMQIHSIEDATTLESILNAIKGYFHILQTYQKAISLGITCRFSDSTWRNRLLVSPYENKIILETDCSHSYEETRSDGYTYRMTNEVKTIENIQEKIAEYREKMKTLTNISKVFFTKQEWETLDIETTKSLLSLFDIEIADDTSDYNEDDD